VLCAGANGDGADRGGTCMVVDLLAVAGRRSSRMGHVGLTANSRSMRVKRLGQG
jgi:hypothetical protein